MTDLVPLLVTGQRLRPKGGHGSRRDRSGISTASGRPALGLCQRTVQLWGRFLRSVAAGPPGPPVSGFWSAQLARLCQDPANAFSSHQSRKVAKPHGRRSDYIGRACPLILSSSRFLDLIPYAISVAQVMTTTYAQMLCGSAPPRLCARETQLPDDDRQTGSETP